MKVPDTYISNIPSIQIKHFIYNKKLANNIILKSNKTRAIHIEIIQKITHEHHFHYNSFSDFL